LTRTIKPLSFKHHQGNAPPACLDKDKCCAASHARQHHVQNDSFGKRNNGRLQTGFTGFHCIYSNGLQLKEGLQYCCKLPVVIRQ